MSAVGHASSVVNNLLEMTTYKTGSGLTKLHRNIPGPSTKWDCRNIFLRNQRANRSQISYGACFGLENLNMTIFGEHSGLVVECLTRERGAAGS